MTTEQRESPRHRTVLDDDVRRVAHVYAEALLSAAEARGQSAEVLAELESLVRDVLDRDPKVELFLSSAAVGRERKRHAIRDAFGGTSDVLTNFLLVLNDHDRLGALRAVALAYRDLYDRRAGRMHVTVESAVPLADEQQDRLRDQLRRAFQREPVLETRIDPDLLGGLVVRVDDWVYDASIRTRLSDLRKQLIERSTHEVQSGRDRFRTD
jgi:F-type H+-transporting ATPase subunit delta